MLHRVVMDLLHVLDEIPLIPDWMLPNAALPDRLLLLLLPHGRRSKAVLRITAPAEGALDEPPAS